MTREIIFCEVEECCAKGCDELESKYAATTVGYRPTAVADVVTGTVQACTFGLGGMFSGGSTLCVADIGPIGFEAVMVSSCGGACAIFARAGEPVRGCLPLGRSSPEGGLFRPTVGFEWRNVAMPGLFLLGVRAGRPEVPFWRNFWGWGCFKGSEEVSF